MNDKTPRRFASYAAVVGAIVAGLAFGGAGTASNALADTTVLNPAPDYSMSGLEAGDYGGAGYLAFAPDGTLWADSIDGHLAQYSVNDDGTLTLDRECSIVDSGGPVQPSMLDFSFDADGDLYAGRVEQGWFIVTADALSNCDGGNAVEVSSSWDGMRTVDDVLVHDNYAYATAGGEILVYDISNPALPALTGYIETGLVEIPALATDGTSLAVVESQGFGGLWKYSLADIEGHGDTLSPAVINASPVTSIEGTISSTNGLGGEENVAFACDGSSLVLQSSNNQTFPTILNFAADANSSTAQPTSVMYGTNLGVQLPSGIVTDAEGRVWIADPAAHTITRWDAYACTSTATPVEKDAAGLPNTGSNGIETLAWAALAGLALLVGAALTGVALRYARRSIQ